MKLTLSLFAIGLATLPVVYSQTTRYYDVDGTTPGWGSPNGTSWDATAGAYWSTDATGSTAGIVWPNNSSPSDILSFGSSSTPWSFTNTQTITLNGIINAAGIDTWLANTSGGFGQPLLFTGGTIDAGANNFTIRPQVGAGTNASTQNLRIDSVIQGSGGLTLDTTTGTINGSVETRLGGDNSYSGVTTVRDSVLAVYHANALGATGSGNGTVIEAGGRVSYANNATTIYAAEDIINQGGNGIRFANGNATLSGNFTLNRATAFGNVNGVGFDVRDNNRLVTWNGNLTTTSSDNTQTSAQILLSTAGRTNSQIVINGTISDGQRADLSTMQTRLLVTGNSLENSSVELAGNNSFTGDVYLRNGATVLLSHNNAFGTSAGGLYFGDGGGGGNSTMRVLTKGAYTIAEGFTFNEASGGAYTAIIGGNHSSGTSTFSGGIGWNDTTTSTYQLTAATGGTVIFSGVINDSTRTRGIGIVGGGTVVLSNANTYDGATTIATGATLQLGNGSTTGALATTSAITNNGTLIFNRSDSLTQGTNFAATIGGTGALVKNGAGTLNLSGNNASSAGFTINQGAVYVTHNNALGANSNVVTMSGLNATELRLNANGLNLANAIQITASAGANASTLRNQVGESTVSGLITYKNLGTGRIDHSVVVAGGTTLNINGGVVADDASNAFISRMAFTSTGTVNFNSQVNNSSGGNNRQLGIQQYGETAVANWNSGSANSTFSGGYEVARGTVNVNTSNPFDASQVVLASGASAGTSNILFQTTGAYAVGSSFTVNNNNSSGLTTLGGNHTSGTSTYSGNIGFQASRDLRLTAASGGTVEFSGEILDGANTSSLTKVGLGTMALTRAAGNSFDGGVTVSEGTLLVNNTTGSGTGTGTVNVNSGATLGGNGTISGAVNVTGVLSPGNSAGVITINNNLTLNDTAAFAVELNGTTVGDNYDRLVLGGTSPTLSLNGINNLLLSLGFTPEVNDLFFIADVAGGNAISGVFEQLNGVTTTLTQGSIFTLGATQFQISYTGNVTTSAFADAGNDLALVVIPEPRAALLGGLGLLALLRRRRG